MADDSKMFNVHVRRTPLWFNLIMWPTLVGSLFIPVAASRMWFGGAWVIDLAALLLALLMFVGMMAHAKRVWLRQVIMTEAELRAWLDAGCPEDA